MKRNLLEIDSGDQGKPLKKPRITPKKNYKKEVFLFAQNNRLQEAINIIAYEKEEDQLLLVYSLLKGLVTKKLLDTACNYIKTFKKLAQRRELQRYVVKKIINKNGSNDVIKWISMQNENDKYYLARIYLNQIAKKGFRKIGLKFIRNHFRNYWLSLRKFFLIQLIVNGHIKGTLDYVESVAANRYKRFRLREAVVIGFAKKNEFKLAEQFIDQEKVKSKTKLRRILIENLIMEDYIISASVYVKMILEKLKDADLRYQMRKTLVTILAACNYETEAVDEIIKSPTENYRSLLHDYLKMIEHDYNDNNANLEKMFFLNHKLLNITLLNLIYERSKNFGTGLDLLKKADKLLAIKKKYQIESFVAACKIAEIEYGTRWWMLSRDTLFYQKNLPGNVSDKITQELLKLPAGDTQEIIQAVRSYHSKI